MWGWRSPEPVLLVDLTKILIEGLLYVRFYTLFLLLSLKSSE